MIIQRGTILTLETGEYSDFSYHGPFVVLKDFDQAAVAKAFRKQWKPSDEWDEEPSAEQFIAWFAAAGYVKDADRLVRWGVGSGYSFDPDIAPTKTPGAA